MRTLFVLTAIVLAISGCALNPVTGRPDFVLFTQQQEIDAGSRFHLGILDEYSLYPDASLNAYIREVGGRIASVSHRSDMIYRFFVLDSSAVNAFALPGGYVYVSRGMLAYLEDESQLAAVLAHEVAHVAARHGVRQQSRGVIAGMLGSVVGSTTGSAAVGDFSNTLGSILISGYSRRHELEADRLAVGYLVKSGYSPSAMLEVIDMLDSHRRIEASTGIMAGDKRPAYHGLLSTHPHNQRRLRRAARVAASYPASDAVTGREAFLEQMDGLLVGPSSHQGMIQGDIFLHPKLDAYLRLPAGWFHVNRPDRLVSTSPDGDSIVQVVLGDPGEQLSLPDDLKARFPDFLLDAGAAADPDTVFGAASFTTPSGVRMGRLAARKHEGRLFLFAGIDTNGESPELDSVVASLRSLDPDEFEATRERAIALVRVRPGDTFETISGREGRQLYPVDALRLLNGALPSDQPVAGDWVKVPRLRRETGS